MTDLGFIGLGIMGKPMAGHLVEAGHTVHVFSRSPGPVRELEAVGAVACNSAKEVSERSDIVFIMVPDTPDVDTVLFGPNGVAEGARRGSVVVDMSSISPIATKEFAQKLESLGVEMLDAPVSGGQLGAQNATLSIMVGGKAGTFEKIKPFFKLMGQSIVHVGPSGDGQTCKVANQIVVALTIEAVGEALLLASKAGADPSKVRDALMGGFAGSRILEFHGERMLGRSFEPGFRISLHQKDLNLALEAARELGVSLPNTATAQELFNAVKAQKGGDLDHSAMVMALETLADHKIEGG
ncbi:MAG: 2-hydroxy-3-oxopropionate reductase [Desulfobacteraceae bacterium]|nr:MAG: 2-hydroxy-3-oxopropionate reductase [Desulfobacteraceae bacterium]